MSVLNDKTFIGLVCGSFFSTIVTFYFLKQFLVKNSGIWTAPMFIPIYYFVVFVFVLNVVLGAISYKKERFLSLGLNFVVISVDILVMTALILNIKNPNG
jgi:hypothetical protein